MVIFQFASCFPNISEPHTPIFRTLPHTPRPGHHVAAVVGPFLCGILHVGRGAAVARGTMPSGGKRAAEPGSYQWIGLRENLEDSPIFDRKIYGFL